MIATLLALGISSRDSRYLVLLVQQSSIVLNVSMCHNRNDSVRLHQCVRLAHVAGLQLQSTMASSVAYEGRGLFVFGGSLGLFQRRF